MIDEGISYGAHSLIESSMESSSAWKTEIKTGAILSRALGVTLDHYSMLVWAVLVHGMLKICL